MISGCLQKRGKIWYAVWRVNGRQRWQSTRETSKTAAQTVLHDLVSPLQAADRSRALRDAAEAADREAGASTGRRVRLDEIWDRFATSPHRPDSGPVTMRVYQGIWRRFHEWMQEENPKSKTIADVSHTVAGDYATHLLTLVGTSTYNKHIGTFGLIWKTLNKRTGSNDNPWKNVARRRNQPVSKRELTIAELESLAALAKGEYRILIALGTFTGLRLVDCATLLWSEVDLQILKIRRVPRKTARKNGRLVVIPIANGLADMLQAQRLRHPTSKDVLPGLASRWRKGHPSKVERDLRRLFDAAGITRMAETTPAGHMRRPVIAGFHSLRHTFVSICRTAGVPEAFVMSIVGHSNPSMTRHYTHIGDAAAREAIDSLPDIGGTHLPPAREKLPQWARSRLADMTADNWQETRAYLLADPQARSSSQPAQLNAPSTNAQKRSNI